MKLLARALLVVVAVLLPSGAFAQRPTYTPQPAPTREATPLEWVDLDVDPPDYPVPRNLVEFNTSIAQRNHAYVDTGTLTVGDDGVVRYSMVIQASGGVDNVTFEGIRCATREFRIYAVGDRGGRWAKAAGARWHPIEYKEINNQRQFLYRDIFCPTGSVVGSREEAIQALKRGINSKVEPRMR